MDGSGDHYESENFKRINNHETLEEDDDSHKTQNYDYIRELIHERNKLDNDSHAARLLDQEIHNAKASGKPFRDTRYCDVYREKSVKVIVKVIVPVKEYPKFNFVGKLLGPKGNSMRRLQEETLCKMAILGRGSMRDRKKEEDLRQNCDPKYAHLNEDLHVEITAIAPPSECYARVAFALAEVRKYLIPDSNDTIRQEQLREILAGEAGEEAIAKLKQKPQFKNYVQSERAPPPPSAATHSHHRSVVSPKTKVMSILDRARIAMEESYKAAPHEPSYDHHHYEETSYSGYHHTPHVESYSHRQHYRFDPHQAPQVHSYHHHRETYPAEKSVQHPSSSSTWREMPEMRRSEINLMKIPRSEICPKICSGPRSEYDRYSSRFRHEPYPKFDR